MNQQGSWSEHNEGAVASVNLILSALDEVVADCSVVVIERRGAPNGPMLPEDELRSMQECLYLLRSQANAHR